MCVSVLLNLLWLLPVTLLDTISAGDSTKSPLCQALPSHSYSIPVLPAPDRNYTGVGRFSSSSAINCSDSGRLVAVKVQKHSNRHTARAGIFVCPGVKILHLQVIGVTGHFLHVPVKATLTSCARANDTAVLRKGRHRSHFTVRFAFSHPLSSRESLNYSYSVYEDSVSKKHHGNDWPVAEDDHHSIQPGFRWKRAVQNRESTMPPSLNSTAGKQDLLTDESTAECGLSKTCIRYGFKGCGHLTCDYMLSYHVINTTDVDMEISARGTGWVAVGFSSDKFMGGDDDVIGCKRDRKLSSKVVAMSLGNLVKHTPPKEKKHRLVLKDGRLQDGHIYCRVVRPLKFKERIADSDLDLFNDWHQLYAFGDIDGTGRILQHTELPRVSENKIAMIRVTNIMVVTSVASFPLSASGFLSLLLPLLLAFDGS